MNAEVLSEYRDGIIQRMKSVGVFRDEFLPTIERLAVLYCQRDKLEIQYTESGENPVIMHTNKAGATNPTKNPFLAARDEVYSQLLAHERELGLTPAGLKKINDAAVKITPRSSFADAIARAMDGAGG